jgi:hypothetical protein
MNMHKTLSPAALLGASLISLLTAGGLASAETLVVDDQVVVRESTVERPTKGATMAKVEARFGAPQARHPAVGQPPITRWDYAGFSVFFEHDRVIHAVALAD